MTKIAVIDDYQNVAESMANWGDLPGDVKVDFYRDTLTGEGAIAERLLPYEFVVTMRERTRFPSSLLEQLPNLRMIAGTGARQGNVDMGSATRLGIAVCWTESTGIATIELTWALIFAITRRIPQQDAAIRKGLWQTSLGFELHGKTLGLLGIGRIGGGVAAAAAGFGMKVTAWTPNLTAERATERGATLVEREELFQSADILSVHVPLRPETRGIVGAAELAIMKRSALLVNTARGPIVDEAALLPALTDRTISGAAIDVFSEEPLPTDYPLAKLENVVLSPHLGYTSEENFSTMYGQCVENIRGLLEGNPSRVLNPDALADGHGR